MIRRVRSDKFSKKIFSDEDGLRFATPEIVAEYRAKRLKCNIIGELGCGIGGQTIYFAKYSKDVIAAERSEERLECAKRNCKIYGVSNVKFVHGDVMSEEVRRCFRDAEIIFCDPSRPPEEDFRDIMKTEPKITEIMRFYGEFTENFSFEVPPQIPPSRVPFECEKEYVSLNHQLNRLNLYLGDLKRSDVSVVILPGEYVLCGDGEIKYGGFDEYLHEVDPAVIKAGLIGVLCERYNLHICFRDERRVLLSGGEVSSPFLKHSYRLISICNTLSEVKSVLKKMRADKAILRFKIDPSEYWRVRRKVEEGLNGEKVFHIFRGEKYIVCERLR
jgi:SAM-dependent methyltransferase